jgi:hypothetical protein
MSFVFGEHSIRPRPPILLPDNARLTITIDERSNLDHIK